MIALLVDWALCTLVVVIVIGPSAYFSTGSNGSSFTLLVYVLESALLTWLAGGSAGKLITGLCVVPADGRLRRLSPVKVLVRQILIALVIPPLVFRNDGRGLHDVFAGTATVTFATLRDLAK